MRKDGIEKGTIRFIKYVDQQYWLIDFVSEGVPASRSDFSAGIAKDKIESAGFELVAGKPQKQFIYV